MVFVDTLLICRNRSLDRKCATAKQA